MYVMHVYKTTSRFTFARIQTNKIAYMYLGAYIYLSIRVLHKTGFDNVLPTWCFFQCTSATAVFRRELERMKHTIPSWIFVGALDTLVEFLYFFVFQTLLLIDVLLIKLQCTWSGSSRLILISFPESNINKIEKKRIILSS